MSKVMDWSARCAEMVEFVGLTAEDRQLIKASSPMIMAHVREINDWVYDNILKFPEARKFFVTKDDQPDAKRIEDNKQTMITWLRATAAAPANDGFVRYLVAVSQMHKNIPVHRPHLSPVAPRYIIGTLSYYQTVIAQILHKEMADATLAMQTSIAWNKWMMVGLELLLADYLTDNE